ncbi:UvrD-helicase domain-containing protein [Nocardiopsis akebiae]|uniref:DNA 3'-5' helicase n=1 Tax=Nocardiopsis akebiae TaxID=2831968 RepID=A0ABX8C9U1_9ACTN|nr:UvrD-helicase domain-containing protein [Nocardiopsis akebiae]QUX31194.1 UvrD-helicase domain-containing protein [Nocardiopsis akebiae]
MSVQDKATLRLLDKADKEIRKLPRNVKGALYDFQYKFRENPTAPGLHFKALKGHDRLFSARLIQDYRVILFHVGNQDYILVALRPRGEVYEHLDRFRFEINAVTGALEIFDVVASAEASAPEEEPAPAPAQEAPAPPAPEPAAPAEPVEPVESIEAAKPADPGPRPLLADYSEEQLRELGVADGLVSLALTITSESRLLGLVEYAPRHTEEVLLALADGRGFDEVMEEVTRPVVAPEPVDTTDYAAALARPATRVTTSDTELQQVLEDDFAAWKVFLHPTQRKLVDRVYKGPARVSGGPGTGKTIVALHRVKYLVERLPKGFTKPVLLTTFNKNLAADLRRRMLDLGGQELLDRVDIVNIDQLASRIVSESGQGRQRRRTVNDQQAAREWEDMLVELGEQNWDADFLNAEWSQVILGQSVRSRSEYFRARRAGRGQRVSRAQRAEIWQLVERFTMRLEERGVWTFRQVAEAAARVEVDRAAKIRHNREQEAKHGGPMLHRQDQSFASLRFRYEHVVVDEAQDLNPAHWTLLRAMVDHKDDDIFLVGDTHQRIYGNQVSLGSLGINIVGRASRLTLSYRTTREILGSALGLLGEETWDDLDEGTDTLRGYRSVLRGPRPAFRGADTWEAEMRALVGRIRAIRERSEAEERVSSIAVAVPTRDMVGEVERELVRAGISAASLGPEGPPPGKEQSVHVGTLHRYKGLEYQHVLIAGITDGLVPAAHLERYRDSDGPRYRKEMQQARSLLFVAATRARDSLVVSWHGEPSRFLPPNAAELAAEAEKAETAEKVEGDAFEDGGLFKPPGALL